MTVNKIKRLTSIEDSYGPAPDSSNIAKVVSGNTVVVNTFQAGILSFSDVGHHKAPFLIHHGVGELLIPPEPGVPHRGGRIVNGAWKNQILSITIFSSLKDIDVWMLFGKARW